MREILRAHWLYLLYVLHHKYYVGRECFRSGLYWQGTIHDWTKFLPSEWFPYVEHFYIKKERVRHNEATNSPFDYAWLYHQRRNPHHWQYWILVQDTEPTVTLEMPSRYAKEMVCDWIGAGLAMGKPDIIGWYLENKHKIKLHPNTQMAVEIYLGLVPEHEL